MTSRAEYAEPPRPAFLFDLDGTLIDSVYQNVIAWRHALAKLDIDLAVWRIHRRIGMSGGLFVSALLRETGRSLSDADIEAVQQDHAMPARGRATGDQGDGRARQARPGPFSRRRRPDRCRSEVCLGRRG